MSRYIYITDDCLMDIAYEHMDDNALIGLQNALEEIPTADVAPVVHGEWVPTRKESDISFCSNCESYWIIRDDAYDYMYCPKCGAKMEV